jgi:1-aminocyclopropane-1-carboxylate deaminase/D-cysteine desulfhydrase-like pyridoxal-dependent ACC family enzyme
MKETADLLGWDDLNLGPEDLHLVDMSGPGYAIPSQEGDAAIRFLAEQEGLFLDPVYTGKAFAGLMKLAEQGAFRREDNVLFLHTGGIGGLFALEQK